MAPGGRSSASSRVTVTVIDQYGRGVNNFRVNAISNQTGDTNLTMTTGFD